jgi:hypothetical protein
MMNGQLHVTPLCTEQEVAAQRLSIHFTEENFFVIQISNKMQQWYLGFIARSLYMFRALSTPIIRSTITAVDSHWY